MIDKRITVSVAAILSIIIIAFVGISGCEEMAGKPIGILSKHTCDRTFTEKFCEDGVLKTVTRNERCQIITDELPCPERCFAGECITNEEWMNKVAASAVGVAVASSSYGGYVTDQGQDTDIDPNHAPYITLEASPDGGDASPSLTVTFTATATDEEDGTDLSSYELKIMTDGGDLLETVNSAPVNELLTYVYTFYEPDTYFAYWTVRDSQNAVSTTSVAVEVTSPGDEPPPEGGNPLDASIEANPSTDNPMVVNYECTASGGAGGYSYEINEYSTQFSSEDASGSITFTEGGTYLITCDVTDSAQEGASPYTAVTVTPPPPLTATLTVIPIGGPLVKTVVASCSGSGGVGPYDVSIDYGSGTQTSTGYYTYTADDTITCTVEDTESARAATDSEDIDASLIANLEVTGAGGIVIGPKTVDFDCSGLYGSPSEEEPHYTYYIEFGDGTVTHYASGSHLYQTSGTMTCTVTDSQQNTAQDTYDISVTAATQTTGDTGGETGPVACDADYTCVAESDLDDFEADCNAAGYQIDYSCSPPCPLLPTSGGTTTTTQTTALAVAGSSYMFDMVHHYICDPECRVLYSEVVPPSDESLSKYGQRITGNLMMGDLPGTGGGDLVVIDDPVVQDPIGDPIEPPPEPEPACSDGFDNDQDGLYDMDDPGCSTVYDDDEYNAPTEGCCAKCIPWQVT